MITAMSFEPSQSWGSGWGVVLSYLLAAVTGIVGVVLWLLGRSLVLKLLQSSAISHWAWGAIDKFSFLLLAIAWLVLVLVSRNYYERGSQKGKLWPRFLRVFGGEAVVLLVVVAILTVLH